MEVLESKKGHVVTLTLNRPKALNALNASMVHDLTPKFKQYWQEPNQLVIIKGSGEKAFCAGGDIRAIYDDGKAWKEKKSDGKLANNFFKDEYVLNNLISKVPAYVAILNGITMGGGVGLSVHGKYRVATENTVFAMPETAIGFFCDVGGSYFLPRLAGSIGMYLALTGARLKGEAVYLAGIATHFVKQDQIQALEAQLNELSSPNAKSVGEVLAKFHQNPESDQHIDIVKHRAEIDRCFGVKTVEEVFAALKKENTDWSRASLDLLNKMSPTSLKVVFKQMQKGKTMSLQDCLAMEYRMSQSFVNGHDFYEGVRATLVDKDKNPKWKPSSLEEVSDAEVDKYFQNIFGREDLKLN